jgi:hypothetical protein
METGIMLASRAASYVFGPKPCCKCRHFIPAQINELGEPSFLRPQLFPEAIERIRGVLETLRDAVLCKTACKSFQILGVNSVQ